MFVLVNGQPTTLLSVSDRGLQYGDGLFETIAFKDGNFEFLDAHLTRLQLGCERLNIHFKQQAKLIDELTQVGAGLSEDKIIKIIVTRGTSGRGYRPNTEALPSRVISVHPFPEYPMHYQSGITIRLCQYRLSYQPSLAGIKHLNRLDQVLARGEWQDNDIQEGFMLDINDHIIEGTMSNIFIVQSQQLFTPAIKNSGIAGIMRQQLLELALTLNIKTHECEITVDRLYDAEEVFICNSLIGIWPVTQWTERNKQWQYGPITQQLQARLKDIYHAS